MYEAAVSTITIYNLSFVENLLNPINEKFETFWIILLQVLRFQLHDELVRSLNNTMLQNYMKDDEITNAIDMMQQEVNFFTHLKLSLFQRIYWGRPYSRNSCIDLYNYINSYGFS